MSCDCACPISKFSLLVKKAGQVSLSGFLLDDQFSAAGGRR